MFINHIANMLTSKEINTNATSVMRVVFFLFSIHKIVRPADADKIANLAQHPKSLGTAGIYSRVDFSPGAASSHISSHAMHYCM